MLLNDFYTVQAITHHERTINATVLLNKDHAIFSGHFPENPIVPGVCLMTMVKETLERALQQPLQLKEAKSVKFLGVVNPQKNAELHINCSYSLLEDGSLKSSSTITAVEMVCYKASAVYK